MEFVMQQPNIVGRCGKPNLPQVQLPIIDLAGLCEGDNDAILRITNEIATASKDWGFFNVINHGISKRILDATVASAFGLFALPKEQKMRITTTNTQYWGYGCAEYYQLTNKEWREGYSFNGPPKTNFRELAEKMMPGQEEISCEVWEEFSMAAESLVREMSSLVITGLGLDHSLPQYDKFLRNTSSMVKLNYYPPCPNPDKSLGFIPHTDGDSLTIVYNIDEPIGGGQIQLKDGRWVATTPVKDSFTVNVGDMFQILSNGKYESTMHRAGVNMKQAWLSVVYSLTLGTKPTEVLDIVAPELVTEENPRKYPSAIIYEEYLKTKKTGRALQKIQLY